MRRSHKIAAIVIALVASQLLSGCYVLRELDWSKDKLSKGDTSKARVGLQGTNDTEDSYFFLIMAADGAELDLKGAKFDKKKVLGNKSQKMIRDDDLLEAASGSDSCNVSVPLRRAGASEATGAYRTKKVVEESNKFVDAELSVKATGNNMAGGLVGLLFSGYWFDDGDGVPEADEDDIGCAGYSTTTLEKKGNQVRSASFLENLSE